MVRNGDRTTLADGLIAVPSNVGPKTMPDYPALAAQGVYELGNGIRVFAGQRDDPFYIDLGATFDTLNFRRTPPLLTAAEDVDDARNPFGVDMLSGFNVPPSPSRCQPACSRPTGRARMRPLSPSWELRQHQPRAPPPFWVVPRAGHLGAVGAGAAPGRSPGQRGDHRHRGQGPLERPAPESEAEFLDYYLTPRLALALEARLRRRGGQDRPHRPGQPALEVRPCRHAALRLRRVTSRSRPHR